MKDVFGNQFTFANTGGSVDIKSVASLWNLYPQYMNVLLGGNYFYSTEVDEVIKGWSWGYSGIKDIPFNPSEILHRKDPNIQITTNDDLIFGTSKLVPLKKPLSNIALAYESENIVLKNRGARLLISLSKSDADGIESGTPTEKKEVLEDWKEYGLLEGQSQALISRMPLDVTVIDQDIRKLGIFETIANDSMSVNNTYGIAHDLVKLWISGSTFENQEKGEVRTYQSTIIPEFNDWVNDIDNWLQLEKYGLQYIPSFENVAVLQKNAKEKATANNITSKYHQDLFLKNQITSNVWLQSLGLPPDAKDGHKKILDFSPEELSKMGISVTVTNGNDGND